MEPWLIDLLRVSVSNVNCCLHSTHSIRNVLSDSYELLLAAKKKSDTHVSDAIPCSLFAFDGLFTHLLVYNEKCMQGFSSDCHRLPISVCCLLKFVCLQKN